MNATDKRKLIGDLVFLVNHALQQVPEIREVIKGAGVDLERSAPLAFHALRGVGEFLLDPKAASRSGRRAAASAAADDGGPPDDDSTAAAAPTGGPLDFARRMLPPFGSVAAAHTPQVVGAAPSTAIMAREPAAKPTPKPPRAAAPIPDGPSLRSITNVAALVAADEKPRRKQQQPRSTKRGRR